MVIRRKNGEFIKNYMGWLFFESHRSFSSTSYSQFIVILVLLHSCANDARELFHDSTTNHQNFIRSRIS